MVEYDVVIEESEDGWYVVSVPQIPGCYTQGKTVEQALERIKEAIEVCLEADGEEVVPMKFVGVRKVQVAK